METEVVKISKIKKNPNNPRLVKDDKFKKLVQSIKDFPEMLKIRPIVVNEDMVVLGGNMRLRACKDAGLKDVPIIQASELTEKQQREFIIKDNVGFGEWDWDMIANEWDAEQLDDWGLDIPIGEQIDNLEDDEEIEFEQSVQLEPPKEYILIMAEPNSVDWEEIKETFKLKMVRRGGYKKGSAFDALGLERILYWDDFKKRINDNSSTK
jgi:ParB-like chromosome segregation protein Spo0J